MKQIKCVIRHGFLILLSLFMLYPVIWMFLASFKDNTEVFKITSFFPTDWKIENYINGWNSISGFTFATFFINSFIISGLIVIGTLISSCLTAYPFARLEFKGKKILFSLVLVTMMLPQQVLLIPRYLLYVKFGWTNSSLPLWIPAFFAQVSGAFCIYMMVQFMRGIPKALEESAVVDGCGYFKRFIYIILPNCKPPMFTVAIFSFIWSWDDFLNQLIYLDQVQKYTVALALRMFNDNSSKINWGELFSMSILSLLPCIIIFACAQKYFVEGIATSGIK
ncbi:MAG: carbohydrate ABC transporter permease [Eubacteriales bacterium]